MPGLYLLALLVSLGGVALLDHRFGLALWRSPRTTLITTAVGTVFFLAWDAIGIATGVFVKGDSSLLLGIDLAPHLPLEEPVFLVFLSYLALVLFGAAARLIPAPRERDVPDPREPAA